MESPKGVLGKSCSQFQIFLSPKKSDVPLSANLDITLSAVQATRNSLARTRPLVLSTTPKVTFETQKLNITKQIESTKTAAKRFLFKPVKKTETLKFPSSSEEILKLIPDLPQWTKAELATYDKIYYFSKAIKTISCNFSDDKGDYKIVVGDDLHYRYEILEILGKGSFGQVAKVLDHLTKNEFAIKVIKDRPRYLEQSQTEISMLQFFKDHQLNSYIVHIESSFSFRGHTMIVLELLSHNLYDVLKRNSFRGLSNTLIKKIANQLLEALLTLSQHQIIHCDLKPENILVSDSHFSSVKLIDFGTSCYTNQCIYTYIQSRFYRAPEIVLGIPYTNAIDLWSFGSILVELYTGLPIFPAENEKELMCRVVEVLGEPPLGLLAQGSRAKVFFAEDGQLRVKSKKGNARRNLRSILKGADEGMVQIVEGCLKWDPAERIAAGDGLRSKWFLSEEGERFKKRCRISLEGITKNAPKLQKYLSAKVKN